MSVTLYKYKLKMSPQNLTPEDGVIFLVHSEVRPCTYYLEWLSQFEPTTSIKILTNFQYVAHKIFKIRPPSTLDWSALKHPVYYFWRMHLPLPFHSQMDRELPPKGDRMSLQYILHEWNLLHNELPFCLHI